MSAELLLIRDGDETWSLVREGGRPVELRVECAHDEPPAGSIVKGRVDRVLPGIQAAFVDVGGERNGFLQGVEVPAPGQPLVVQIEREALSDKGPRLTDQPKIAGWRLVYMTHDPRRTVSRRIRDEAERRRLQDLIEALPGDGGFIARTAAAGADVATLEREAAALEAEWRDAARRAEGAEAPALLRAGPGLALRTLQSYGAGLACVRVGDETLRVQLLEFLRQVGSPLADHVERCDVAGLRSAMHEAVEKALQRKVWLRSGGHLLIERTEALTSIDVNTGKFLGRGGAAETALRTNREAAAEIARQLRLRDIGGLVVIDFIQLADEADRRAVLEALRDGLADDPCRTRVSGFSPLGLVELARTRTRETPETRATTACPQCAGRGRIRRPERAF